MVKFYSSGKNTFLHVRIPASKTGRFFLYRSAAVFLGGYWQILTVEVMFMGGNKDGQKKKSKAERDAKTGTHMKRNP